MVKRQKFLFFVSILSYMFAILLHGLEPVLFLFERNYIYFNSNILCVLFTMISFYLITNSFQIKRKRFSYTLLLIMIYFALIIGNNNVFDYVLKRILNFYENHNLTESDKYEKMWSLWTNDLSRNLMYFFGILYSFFGTLVYILVVRLKKYGEFYKEFKIRREDK